MRDTVYSGLAKRSIETIEAIELAALREFSERGFDETTAEHIAAASGVSIRTFFRYFQRGKDDVMVLAFRRFVHQLGTAMSRRPPQESAWVALREAARAIPQLGAGEAMSAEAARLYYLVSRRNPEIHARTTGYQYEFAEPLVEMAALRMSVDPKVDVRPRLMVHCMITASTVAWLAWVGNEAADSVLVFAQSMDMLGKGLDFAKMT